MKAVFVVPSQDEQSFEKIMWLRTVEIMKALERAGVEVLPIEFDTIAQPAQLLIDKVVKFNPDFVSAPNYNYLLIATASSNHLFTHIRKPVVALWDDPLGGLANHLHYVANDHLHYVANDQLNQLKERNRAAAARGLWPRLKSRLNRLAGRCRKMLSESEPTTDLSQPLGACSLPEISDPLDGLDIVHPLEIFKERMVAANVHHFSWDTGHMKAVSDLGLVREGAVQWYPLTTFDAFINFGRDNASIEQTVEVSFCGNIYLDYINKHEYWQDDSLRTAITAFCDAKTESLEKSNYDLFLKEVERLPADIRQKYRLWPNRKPYWDFYMFAIWHAANTLVRLNVLSQVKRDVIVYGLFADPRTSELLGSYKNISFGGNHHHFNELPRVYASSKINICLSNGLIYQGVPSKLLDCVASGGFALCDPKDDLVRLFGDGIKRVFFRNPAELNEKIEYFLDRPAEREAIVRELQATIVEHCTLDKLCRQVVTTIEGSVDAKKTMVQGVR